MSWQEADRLDVIQFADHKADQAKGSGQSVSSEHTPSQTAVGTLS